jgi:aldose 1-epimerase
MPVVSYAALGAYPVTLVTLRSDSCTALLTDLGARLLEFHVPDREGNRADVVLSRATMEEVFSDRNYMGSTAGRYAGRIRSGQFSLDGEQYQLARNEGMNHLHGGDRGFDQYSWSTSVDPGREVVTFTRVSPHGEEGFPGELTARVTYRLEGNSLYIEMSATTDRPTIVRLVNHAYWNLAGHDSGTVLDQVLQLNAAHYIPLDDELLPTGEVLSVRGTPFDFTFGRPIGEENSKVPNNGAGRVEGESAGYDHIWVLDGAGDRVVGSITDPASGRRLELATNQRGLCLYVGGYMAGVSAKGASESYCAFAGLTLETTGFPDDVNQPYFPSPILRPGQTYLNSVRLTFSTV